MPPLRLHSSFLARLALIIAAALTAGCGGQIDSTPAVSVLGILNRGALVDRPIVPFQVQEVSSADNKTPSYTYSATGLPTGLQIGETTGLIEGTPTVVGSYPVRVTVKNTKGQSSRSFTWTIVQDTVSFKRLNSTQIQLDAADTANYGTTHWCFKATSTASGVNPSAPDKPTATDTCWQTSRTKTFDLALDLQQSVNTPMPRFNMWSRDYKDYISDRPVRGPCSEKLLQAAKTLSEQQPGKQFVCLSTSLGELGLMLDSTAASVGARNLMDYVDSGFYDSTTFHRLLSSKTASRDFALLQGGRYVYSTAYSAKTTGLKDAVSPGTAGSNATGSVALAYNYDAGSNTYSFLSQFAINLADNTCLDAGQTCAGKDASGPSGMPVIGQVFFQTDDTFAKFIERLKTLSVTTGITAGEASQPSSLLLINSAVRLR